MPAEVEKIVAAIKRRNPKASTSSAWAIAYSTYNKKHGKKKKKAHAK